MIKLTIARINLHAICVLGFSSLRGLKIVVSVKRQFKYWSNRAISICFGLHMLTAEKPIGSRGSAMSGGVVTVGKLTRLEINSFNYHSKLFQKANMKLKILSKCVVSGFVPLVIVEVTTTSTDNVLLSANASSKVLRPAM